MKLVLIRHGESEWNQKNLFTGWTDVDLTEAGREEARSAGALLKKEGFDFDLCYTSYLKRAIHTLNLVLEQMDREWLPVVKSWQLNERHYGALQGLNKEETSRKYGEEQVHVWRRSFDVRPPLLAEDDERLPGRLVQYREVPAQELPRGESLKDTIARVIPYFEANVRAEMEKGRRVLLAAHGNSIRALVYYFEKCSSDEITKVNIPTGVPLVYTFDPNWKVTDKAYLGDPERIRAKIQSVANQGKASAP